MKKLFKSILAVTVATLSLASCNKEYTPVQEDDDLIEVTFSAEPVALETRTHINEAEAKFEWDEEDVNQSKSLEFVEIIDDGALLSFTYNNAGGQIVDGKANFITYVNAKNTGSSYKYSAIYPYSAWDASTESNNVGLVLPATQYPSVSSYDKKGDLLVANIYEKEGSVRAATSDVLPLSFRRISAVGKITLKNIPAAETVKQVIFATDEATLAGKVKVDILTENSVPDWSEAATNSVTINYSTAVAPSTPVWFTCKPGVVEIGQTYSVTVITNAAQYVKSGTIVSKELTFKAGAVTSFGVDFTEAEVTPIVAKTSVYNKVSSLEEIVEGQYIIISKDYYLPSARTGGSAHPVVQSAASLYDDGTKNSITISDTEVENSVSFNFSGSASSMTITNSDGDKLYNTNANNGVCIGDTACSWIILKNNKGFKLQGASERFLQVYSSTNWRCYLSASYDNSEIYLYLKGEAIERTPIESVDAASIEAIAVGNEITASWTAVADAESYTVSISPADAEPQTVNAPEVDFSGLKFNTEYTISIIANPANSEITLSPSAPVTTSVTTDEDNRLPLDETLLELEIDSEKTNTINASWMEVEGACSYTISLNGVEKDTIESAEAVDGMFSYSFTNLSYDTEYTVSVVANPTDPTTALPSNPVSETITTGESAGTVEKTAIITFDGGPGTNGNLWSFSDETSGIKVDVVKASGSTAPRLDSNMIRFYTKNTMTFTAPEGVEITSVAFTMNGSYTMNKVTVDTGSIASNTWTGIASSIVFTAGEQTRFTTATITYLK